MITPAEAKKLTKQKLDEHKIIYTRITAKTVDFTDLARASCIFVTVFGWKPGLPWQNPVIWDDIDRMARANGFRVSEPRP